jgi:hypothetical protein
VQHKLDEEKRIMPLNVMEVGLGAKMLSLIRSIVTKDVTHVTIGMTRDSTRILVTINVPGASKLYATGSTITDLVQALDEAVKAIYEAPPNTVANKAVDVADF